MLIKPFQKGKPQGSEHQRQNHQRQENVRQKDEIINGLYPTLAPKLRRWVRQMVQNIANQKTRSEPKGREHCAAMHRHIPRSNANPTDNQNRTRDYVDRADAVRQLLGPTPQIKFCRYGQQ